ncbi:MAG: hypothetical protein JOS17DRAFT_296371 [Linnemannia elongata]|nr:MAG: hypothetical protein JOS17DRAFT_296371 [Linnemannia elongata]
MRLSCRSYLLCLFTRRVECRQLKGVDHRCVPRSGIEFLPFPSKTGKNTVAIHNNLRVGSTRWRGTTSHCKGYPLSLSLSLSLSLTHTHTHTHTHTYYSSFLFILVKTSILWAIHPQVHRSNRLSPCCSLNCLAASRPTFRSSLQRHMCCLCLLTINLFVE